MEEVERVAYEKYKIIKKQMKNADNETIAILMAINSLSTQLEREIQVEDMEKELEILKLTVILKTMKSLLLELWGMSWRGKTIPSGVS